MGATKLPTTDVGTPTNNTDAQLAQLAQPSTFSFDTTRPADMSPPMSPPPPSPATHPMSPLKPKPAQLLGYTVEGVPLDRPPVRGVSLPGPADLTDYVSDGEADFPLREKHNQAAVDYADVPTPGPGRKKGKNRMKNFLLFASRDKNAPLTSPTDTPKFASQSMHNLGDYASDSHVHAFSSAPRPFHSTSKQKVRQMLAPITEVSQGDEGIPTQDSDDAELELIQYYRGSRPSTAASLPRFNTTSDVTQVYQLDQNDLSEMQGLAGESQDASRSLTTPSFTPVPSHMKSSRRHSPGPIQIPEKRLLDKAADKIVLTDAEIATLTQIRNERHRLHEASRGLTLTTDPTVLELQKAQMEQKKEFGEYKAGALAVKSPVYVPSANEDDDEDDNHSLVSICSSIDTDEEPEVCECNAVQFTRVTPGMVKLVDIPPRKSKTNRTAAALKTKMVSLPAMGSSNLVDLSNERKPVGTSKQGPATTHTPRKDPDIEPFPPYIDNFDHGDDPPSSPFIRPKKSGLPREESRQMVQTWVNQYGAANQRPISIQYDADVLAERSVPPAPLPKDDPVAVARRTAPLPLARRPMYTTQQQQHQASFASSVPLPASPMTPKTPRRLPPRTCRKPSLPSSPTKTRASASNPHCLTTGHLFHPLNLEEASPTLPFPLSPSPSANNPNAERVPSPVYQVPDNAANGRLGARPYLVTSTGARQHVRIPVKCDRCGGDVGGVVWVCERERGGCGVGVCVGCRGEMRGGL